MMPIEMSEEGWGRPLSCIGLIQAVDGGEVLCYYSSIIIMLWY